MRPAGIRALKLTTFALASGPLAWMVFGAFTDRLGANPVEAILNRLGFWTLVLLTASLVPTPAKEWLGLAWPVRVRRMLGLFAFSYASLHLLWYVGADQFFDWPLLVKDVVKRRFMAVGFAAWLMLVPLAVTSTDRWVRRLGYARWKRLHRLVYVAAGLGVVHFVWRVKADEREPLIFATVIGVLMAARLAVRARKAGPNRLWRRPRPAPRPADPACGLGGRVLSHYPFGPVGAAAGVVPARLRNGRFARTCCGPAVRGAPRAGRTPCHRSPDTTQGPGRPRSGPFPRRVDLAFVQGPLDGCPARTAGRVPRAYLVRL
ncbi:MAG: protein-methionine-sulfoxide reductase heme-binding subunit MsrQ [Anaeromyxobacter sp.]